MNDEEFRKKLSEVAEWHLPKLSQTDIKAAKRQRGRPSAEDLYQEEHEEVFLDLFEGVNPTYAPVLLKTKNKACVCEDCGKHCENGRHKETKKYETGKEKKVSWRQRCLTCGYAKNPFTGKFDLTVSEASHVWLDFQRERKGEYVGRYARAIEEQKKKKELEHPGIKMVETETGTITIYPEFNKEDK